MSFQLCRDECELLEHDVCKKELAIARGLPMLDYQIVLPDCNNLPIIGMDTNCVRLGMPSVSQLIKPHSCYVDNGEDYRGTVSMSVSGRTCQPWHSSFNHNFGAHVELVGGHNYCRNPSGNDQKSQPWCFTDTNR